MSALVLARGLAAAYDGSPALTGVTFEAGPGDSVAVLGPNGGGKTTLFRALLGEIAVVAGEHRLERPAAHVAQTERTRLDFPVSALDVALMGALGGGRWWRPPGRSGRRAALEALGRVGLEAEARTRFGELSGGQRQRVLLARALVQDAKVLLLDEPLSGVDPASATRIAQLFDELRGEGRALLVSTHDIETARGFEHVLCLNGRQVAFGRPGETLGPEVLEATYGAEIVMLDEHGRQLRAVTVKHHEH